MLKSLLKKLLMQFIGKKFGFYPSQKYHRESGFLPQHKYYKPKKKKGLAYKLKKIFD